jgi:hypothetical protein
MPAFTEPDGIIYPVPTDPIEPLNAIFQDLAQSTQDAIVGRIPVEWESWIPVYDNMSPADGAVEALYAKIGKTIYGIYSIGFGPNTVMGSDPKISLPEPVQSGCLTVGQLRVSNDDGNSVFRGTVNIDNGSFCPRLFGVSGNFITETAIDSDTPFTWGPDFKLGFYFLYEAE